MSIRYRTQPNPKDAAQIKLFVQCSSEMMAEALWHALQERFTWASNLRGSFNPDFTHFFFVTTSEQALKRAWPQIELDVIKSGSYSAASRSPSIQKEPTSPSMSFEMWAKRFDAAVQTIGEDVLDRPRPSQEISLGWVSEQIRKGNADEVEAALRRPMFSPSSVLRAQIALFSETKQIDRLIALVESRRREVLALPVSELLAEQIIGAYLEFWTENSVDSALQSAQRFAQAFLPELERLHQAGNVRELLRQSISPQLPPERDTQPTLQEQIAGLIQISPAEQIDQLEDLRKHADSADLHIALGDAYAATGDVEAAISAYANAASHNEHGEEDAATLRQAEVLLLDKRFTDVDQLLTGKENSPILAGLRGAALFWEGRRSEESKRLLQIAWEVGERRRALLLPMARTWRDAGEDELAQQAHRLLMENAPDILESQDIYWLVLYIYTERPDDVSIQQIANLCDRYVSLDGPKTQPPSEVSDILSIREELWRGLDHTRWRYAIADLLEWLAEQGDAETLDKNLDRLRKELPSQDLSARQEHFDLLEGLAFAAPINNQINALLASETQSVCTDAVAIALRRNEAIPHFVNEARRLLHFLDRPAADDLDSYIRQEQDALAKRNLSYPEQPSLEEAHSNLANISLSIVGGHTAMRREVERELRESHHLVNYAEIGPSSDEHIDRAKVRDRVVGRDLIVVITGYTGHDLTNLVRDLQSTKEITGKIIWPTCRGKSGVLREIIAAAESM